MHLLKLVGALVAYSLFPDNYMAVKYSDWLTQSVFSLP